MQKYEILAIITNSLDAKKAEEQAKISLSNRIKELGGNVTFEDFWGERGFAYKIKGEKWGYYFCAQFEIDTKHITELKKEWNIDRKLVRFLITKVDASAPAPRPYQEMKKEWETLEKEQSIKELKTPKKRVEKLAEAPQEKAPTEEKSTTSEKPKKAVTPKTTEEPKSTEAPKDIVDKKLDEILSDSSLDL